MLQYQISDNNSHAHALISESASSSSQPSLPSVPSLDSHTDAASPPPRCHCTSTTRAHSSYVSALALYTSNTFLSCSPDQTIKLWHTPYQNDDQLSANILIASTACKSPVKSLLLSTDRIIFTSHQDGRIRAWRPHLNKMHPKLLLLAILPTLKDRFFSIFSPKRYIQVHRHKRCTWVKHADAVSALATSHDGKFLYSASWDRTFKVWCTSSFKCTESISGAHEDAINAIVMSKDGFIYTGSADTKIKAWTRLRGEKSHSLVSTMERHRSAVNALALSEDGLVLYSGACDRSVVVWQGRHGEMVAVGTLRGHRKAVLCLAVKRDVVYSGSTDKTIRIWRQEKETERSGYCYSCLAVLEGHAGAVKSLAIRHLSTNFCDTESEFRDKGNSADSDSYIVYSGGMDGEIKAWRLVIPSEVIEEQIN